MALKQLEKLDVYYGSSRRSVTLYSGDLAALGSVDAVDYMAVSTLPNFYLEDSGTLLYSLAKKGVSVKALSQNKDTDYRPEIPCWISKPVSNINANRLIIFEPNQPKTTAYDLIPYIFSAIALRARGRASDLKIALPMLCTGKSGADSLEILEALFYSSVHWGAMKFPFKEIKLVIYDNDSRKEALRQKFKELKYSYEHLENLFSTKAYTFYAKQALTSIEGVQLPEYLTQRQYFAIRLYTGNYYTTINRILRKNDRKSPEHKKHMPLFEALDTGLMNIPPYKGMTYRGTYLNQQELDKHKVGASYRNLAYTSTAYKKGGWYSSAYVKLDIDCHTGSCVEPYSYFPGENEILYVRGMDYKILTKNYDGKDYYFKTNECVNKFRR